MKQGKCKGQKEAKNVNSSELYKAAVLNPPSPVNQMSGIRPVHGLDPRHEVGPWT